MAKTLEDCRVAIVFEWFNKVGGSERAISEIFRVFPRADLFALVHDPENLEGTPLEGAAVKSSFIQRLPFSREKYQYYLPLMPIAVEQFDLRNYDIVISSSHTVGKGVLTNAGQLHVSYMYTPMRYAWDLYLQYLYESGVDRGVKSAFVRMALHYLRMWDVSASSRVDAHIAISEYVARRIRKLYRRPTRVVYPPVDVHRFDAGAKRGDSYVAMSRFVPYKCLDVIVKAFTKMDRPLTVIGDGPDRAKIKALAGPSVKILGYQSDEAIAEHLSRARAFVFAADEDFGIIPVEAQASGAPVIAFGKGGSLETVVGWPSPGATGVFFDAQTPEAIEAAVVAFEANEEDFSPAACRANAELFTRQRFTDEFRTAVEEAWQKFQRGEDPDLSSE